MIGFILSNDTTCFRRIGRGNLFRVFGLLNFSCRQFDLLQLLPGKTTWPILDFFLAVDSISSSSSAISLEYFHDFEHEESEESSYLISVTLINIPPAD